MDKTTSIGDAVDKRIRNRSPHSVCPRGHILQPVHIKLSESFHHLLQATQADVTNETVLCNDALGRDIPPGKMFFLMRNFLNRRRNILTGHN